MNKALKKITSILTSNFLKMLKLGCDNKCLKI